MYLLDFQFQVQIYVVGGVLVNISMGSPTVNMPGVTGRNVLKQNRHGGLMGRSIILIFLEDYT